MLGLLICLTVVRLGVARIRIIKGWLDKGMLEEPCSWQLRARRKEASTITETTSKAELGTESTNDISGFTDLTIESTDCTKFMDNSTDPTDLVIESTGRTDCAKLTDVCKHHISDYEGLQYTTFLQSSALPTTQLTSDSQG
jgi:hypothetical protein